MGDYNVYYGVSPAEFQTPLRSTLNASEGHDGPGTSVAILIVHTHQTPRRENMPEFQSRIPSDRISRPVMGALMICVLVLILQIPILLIRNIIVERVETRAQALAEVTAIWGGSQSVVGPRLVIPYRTRSDAEDSSPGPGGGIGHASFLPTSLSVRGDLTTQALSRGLFTVPVYQARLTLTGAFGFQEFDRLGVPDEDVLWEQAVLAIEVTNPKAVGSESTATWNGVTADFHPGVKAAAGERIGLHRPVPTLDGTPAEFLVTLELKGSESIWFVPFSRNTEVSLVSNWSSPSFAGAWLPAERQLTREGFSAEWRVPFLGRDYPQEWISKDHPTSQISTSRFGVELISPVDHYRMSERSTKYASMFLLLTFGMVWLFDALVGIQVHPIQYLLIGAGMCLFYLLELSLSEHIGFIGAYLAAGLSIVGLVSAYTVSVLRSLGRGAIVASVLGLLYAFLLTLLSLEQYALLVGSVGLFLALAAVMYLTRWIDWYGNGEGPAP
jgi:inner membrane protein